MLAILHNQLFSILIFTIHYNVFQTVACTHTMLCKYFYKWYFYAYTCKYLINNIYTMKNTKENGKCHDNLYLLQALEYIFKYSCWYYQYVGSWSGWLMGVFALCVHSQAQELRYEGIGKYLATPYYNYRRLIFFHDIFWFFSCQKYLLQILLYLINYTKLQVHASQRLTYLVSWKLLLSVTSVCVCVCACVHVRVCACVCVRVCMRMYVHPQGYKLHSHDIAPV